MRVRMWLSKIYSREGRKNRLLGLTTTIYEGEKVEVRKIVEVVEETLRRHFPDAEIIKTPSVRELFGERG
jgi:hypothetical protein